MKTLCLATAALAIADGLHVAVTTRQGMKSGSRR